MKEYEYYLKGIDINLSTFQWFSIAIIVGLVLGGMVLFLWPDLATLGILLSILTVIFAGGSPILIKQKRDRQIEESLSDVLGELATSLRTGATIEQALMDLTKIQKGPLIEELNLALKDMEGGLSFEEALQNLSKRVDVKLLRRILVVIIDGKRIGGELADILDSVSGDCRELSRLQRERISKTLLYVVFIFFTSAIIAPAIFGFVTQMSVVLAKMNVAKNPLNIALGGLVFNKLSLYIIIETMISGLMITVIRGDEKWKGILLYGAVMALLGTAVFEISVRIAGAVMGGM